MDSVPFWSIFWPDRLLALRQHETAGRHHRLPALRFQAQGLTTVALRLVETTKAQLNASPGGATNVLCSVGCGENKCIQNYTNINNIVI